MRRPAAVHALATIALATLLLAAANPASAQDASNIEIHPTQPVYHAHEDVHLTVTNNASTPTTGTPTIEIRHCTLGERLCDANHDVLATWTEQRRELAPGESFQTTWDQRTDDGDPAPEGAYTAHLTWETPQGTQHTTSPAFSLDPAPSHDEDAPRITVHEPQPDDVIGSTTATIHVEIHAQAPLTHVRLQAGDTTLPADANGQDTLTVHDTLELDPGRYTLTVDARDDDDATNRTTLPFTVAPQGRLTAGTLGFNVGNDGSFQDVTVDDVPLFERVETTGPTNPLQGDSSPLGIAFWSTHPATIALTPADGWTADEHPQGLLLDHPDADRSVALATSTAAPPAQSQGVILADVRPGEGVMVRPVTDRPADMAVVDAILAGQVGAEVHVAEEASVFPYQDVNVSISHTSERVVAVVDAQREDGLSFGVYVDEERFPDARVLLDGTELAYASSPSQALDPASESQAFVATGEDTTSVLVRVDSFSTRDVIVEAAEAAGAFLTVGSVVAGTGLVAVAGWGLFRRSGA